MIGISPEQLRYARLLEYGARSGLVALIAGFAAYMGGVLPVQVPLDVLPRLWSLPAGDFVRESGIAAGWGWLQLLGKADLLALVGIVLLAGASLPCLILLVPIYVARKDWPYLGITLALIGVLALAASGLFGVL
jgi:hypothetical protein